MTKSEILLARVVAGSDWPVLVFVATSLLCASTQAATLSSPYQSSQRGAIGTGLGQTNLPKGGVFEPRVEAALQYVSNINMSSDSQAEIDTAGIELSPGFYASYSSGVFLGAIDYSLIGRAWDESDYDDVSHLLNTNGEWYAVPEWFSLRGRADYRDTVIDPLQGSNYGGVGIFNSGNLTELATASISPVLQHDFSKLHFLAQYQYGRAWYLDEGKGLPTTAGFVLNQDSKDQSFQVSLGNATDTASPVSATVSYDWQKSEYETALPYKYEHAALDLAYQFSRTMSFVGAVGKESDLDASTTKGGLDSDFWNAGLRYEPNPHTTAEGRYGSRFFGDTWSASISHRARLLEFNASYTEEPTVETRTLSLGDFNPGELPPGVPPVDLGRVNSAPYVANDASAGIRGRGSRTSFALNVHQHDRNYLRVQRADEKDTGISLSATRELQSNLSADCEVAYSEYQRSFDPTDPVNTLLAKTRDTTLTLRLNRKAGKSLTFSAETGYVTRNGDSGLNSPGDADGWWVGLRSRWTPGTASNKQ
jgi:uncharacterized protein, PEP-CTERM system associated